MTGPSDSSRPPPDRALSVSLPGVAWPNVASGPAALLLALHAELDATQWLAPEALAERQRRQLEQLVAHADAHVAAYRDRLAPLRGARHWAEAWRSLPVLTRRDVQALGSALHAPAPPEHGKVASVSTSGSTGTPVTVLKTELAQLFWAAFTLRDHHWHRRELGGTLAFINRDITGGSAPPHGSRQANWGPPTAQVYRTGPLARLDVLAPIEDQLSWLDRVAPSHLLTFPTNLRLLLEHGAKSGFRPHALTGITTIGEAVTPALRRLAQELWGVAPIDIYSGREVGYLALQCPASGLYHVQAEGILLEVVDELGRACAPGETGRVLVTPLHNFAHPLLRYELGDYAEQGEPCPCGRGLPTLRRVLGRTRHMVTLPGGRRHFAALEVQKLAELSAIRQAQLVQRRADLIVARLVTDRPLDAAEAVRVGDVIALGFGHRFTVEIEYCDRLERSPSGKFEEFRSELI
jgi:phenylacetate-CoA ligase